MARRAHGKAEPVAEDWWIFVALMATLFFLVLMLSLPIWFSGFIRGLGG